MARKHHCDFTFVNHLSIFLVRANTREARRWVKENVSHDDLAFHKHELVVEPRYVVDLLNGVQSAGFRVELR